MDLVDAHTHVLLPRPVARRIRELFDAHVPGPLVYPVDAAATLGRLCEAGVDTIWSLPYAHRGGTARRFNEHSAEAAGDHAGRGVGIVPGATVHPDDRSPGDVVAEAAELGLRVLKLHSAVGGYTVDDPRLHDAFVACAERGLPVVAHLGRAVDGTTSPGDLAPLATAAATHPDVVFVAAHAGHPATAGTLDLVRSRRNVWADLTPVVDARIDVDAKALAELADQLLFGSDAPNTRHRVEDLVRDLEHRLPSDAARVAVLGGNARRLVPPAVGDSG